MKSASSRPLPPSILIVDDEAQIHSSLRLRLGRSCRLQSALTPKDGLERISKEPHDICIVDVHMPEMDGLTFIEEARKVDPALGFVIFSGYDSDENLRKAIPLQVYDFIPKPLPDRERLEKAVPDWVDRTRQRRRELSLSVGSEAILRDLELTRIQRDIETTAAEFSRDALVSNAGLLSTAQALLANVQHGLEALARADAKLMPHYRSLQEARKQVEIASAITESYFSSAFADRETSPAIVDDCVRHAITIATRLGKAGLKQQTFEYRPLGRDIALSGLTGIDFLLLVVPALLQALAVAEPETTVKVQCETTIRIEDTIRNSRRQEYLWVNRRNASLSSPGALISIAPNGPAPEESIGAAWLRGDATDNLRTPCHGLVHGVQKARGVLGLATRPASERFSIMVVLPI